MVEGMDRPYPIPQHIYAHPIHGQPIVITQSTEESQWTRLCIPVAVHIDRPHKLRRLHGEVIHRERRDSHHPRTNSLLRVGVYR